LFIQQEWYYLSLSLSQTDTQMPHIMLPDFRFFIISKYLTRSELSFYILSLSRDKIEDQRFNQFLAFVLYFENRFISFTFFLTFKSLHLMSKKTYILVNFSYSFTEFECSSTNLTQFILCNDKL